MRTEQLSIHKCAIELATLYDTPLCAAPQPIKQEPVAWRIGNEICAREDWACVISHDSFVGKGRAIPDSWVPLLYAAPVDAKAIRAEALEEAAKVCESTYPTYESDQLPCFDTPADCAKAIRGLK